MENVTFIDAHTAIVNTQSGGKITVENAAVTIKRRGRRWVKVLSGVIHMIYRDFGGILEDLLRLERFELVLGLLALGERLMMAAQEFARGIIPEHFKFGLQTSKVEIVLSW